MIEVNKTIPVPVGCRTKYPWAALEVGDSFFVAGKMTSDLRPVAHYHALKRGWRFLVRSEGNGVRVWRIDTE